MTTKQKISDIQAVLFDLDGTISDNSAGITGCLSYALESLGRPAPKPSELFWCIGPPLRSSFAKLLALSDPVLIGASRGALEAHAERIGSPGFPPAPAEQVEKAVIKYRQRYSEWGWSQNMLFEGIPELLNKLHSGGRTIAVTTTKAQNFAQRIVEHFGLASYFAAVYGPDLQGRLSSKQELVALALSELKLKPGTTAIIGDRSLDILGGKAHGLLTIGVTYGFGSTAELEAAGADLLAGSVVELIALFE